MANRPAWDPLSRVVADSADTCLHCAVAELIKARAEPVTSDTIGRLVEVIADIINSDPAAGSRIEAVAFAIGLLGRLTGGKVVIDRQPAPDAPPAPVRH